VAAAAITVVLLNAWCGEDAEMKMEGRLLAPDNQLASP